MYLSISVKASQNSKPGWNTVIYCPIFNAPVSISIKSPILTPGNNFFCFITNVALLFDKSAARSRYNSRWKSGIFYTGRVTVKMNHYFSFMFFCAGRASHLCLSSFCRVPFFLFKQNFAQSF